jgi:hypothetical protein
MDIDDDDMLSMGRQRSNSAPPCDIPMPLDGSMSPRPKTKATSRSITVVARFRPENAQELANGGKNITKFHPDGSTVDLEVESRSALTKCSHRTLRKPTSGRSSVILSSRTYSKA